MGRKNLFIIILLSIMCSCVTLGPPRIVICEARNDITLKDSWGKFISQNPNPKVVLRVPGHSRDVTQEEMSQLESFYNDIEKKLLEANFTLRDRSLLTTVLNKIGENSISYEEIGKKVDTDIIVEIVNYKIGTLIRPIFYSFQDETPEAGQGIGEYGAALEGRLILVSSNEVVGMFTMKEILPDQYYVWDPQALKMNFILRKADSEYLNTNITNKLIDLMKGLSVKNSKTSIALVLNVKGKIVRKTFTLSPPRK